jgi:hypothetical protein
MDCGSVGLAGIPAITAFAMMAPLPISILIVRRSYRQKGRNCPLETLIIFTKGTQFPYFYRFLISGPCKPMKINEESD